MEKVRKGRETGHIHASPVKNHCHRRRKEEPRSNEQLEQFKVQLLSKCYNLLSSANCPAWPQGNAHSCARLYFRAKNPRVQHCRAANVTGTHNQVEDVTLLSSSQAVRRHSFEFTHTGQGALSSNGSLLGRSWTD